MNCQPPNNQPHLSQPKYRADIDGLRAFAILSVVSFHAFASWVKGGFVGVDVFFVISGFLISTIILNSLAKNNFSFSEFYARRIKRIFPALILVMSTSYVLGWFVLLPDEYKQLGKQIAAGAGFVSNLFFWQEAGYFDSAVETKPMLHLWSLGIEEQFYIVWPLLLYFTWKKRVNLLLLTIAIIAISFAFNVGKVHSDAVQAFYSPVSRIWEFMIGSLLAILGLHKVNIWCWINQKISIAFRKNCAVDVSDQGSTERRNILSLVGTLLIGIAVLVINRGNEFPGWWALLPTLGTYLIISAGQHAWINRMVLSHPVMVWLGLISYPFYLWHWPLLAFARIVESGPPLLEIRIATVLIALALACLTYQLIEKPIRAGRTGGKVVALSILMIITAFTGYSTYKNYGHNYSGFESGAIKSGDIAIVHLPAPSTTKGDHNSLSVRFNTFNTSSESCGDLFNGDKSVFCGKTTNRPNVTILGDSHAGHLYYGFANSTNDFFNKVSLIGTCAPIIGAFPSTNCDEKILVSLKWIKAHPSVKVVVISHSAGRLNATNELNIQLYLEGYLKVFYELKR